MKNTKNNIKKNGAMKSEAISNKIIKIIKMTAHETALATVSVNNKRQTEINYFRWIEKLLYLYPMLKKQIELAEQHIAEMKEEGYPEKSKDIVAMPTVISDERQTRNEIQEERILKRVENSERTKADVAWIDRILSQLVNEEGYQIIELYYFDGISKITGKQYPNKSEMIIAIADELHVSDSTVRRWKNRLIDKIAVYVYGSAMISS